MKELGRGEIHLAAFFRISILSRYTFLSRTSKTIFVKKVDETCRVPMRDHTAGVKERTGSRCEYVREGEGKLEK